MNNQLKIISVLGPHAGESVNEIFDRKQKEISLTKYTLWLHKSYTCKPEHFKGITDTIECLFIEPASRNGSRPTISSDKAEMYSIDKINWKSIPNTIKCTGNLLGAKALVIEKFVDINDSNESDKIIDITDLRFFNYINQNTPIQIRQGASTILCEVRDKPDKKSCVKSWDRVIVKRAYLRYPYCVWVR